MDLYVRICAASGRGRGEARRSTIWKEEGEGAASNGLQEITRKDPIQFKSTTRLTLTLTTHKKYRQAQITKHQRGKDARGRLLFSLFFSCLCPSRNFFPSICSFPLLNPIVLMIYYYYSRGYVPGPERRDRKKKRGLAVLNQVPGRITTCRPVRQVPFGSLGPLG